MRKTVLLASLAAAGLALSAFAAPASADVGVQAHQNAKCEQGELCLYYNSDQKGSFSDFAGGVPDFAPYRFLSKGAGQGQGVKNNAASACNLHKSYHVVIYFNSNWEGPYDTVAPVSCRNLSNTYNENASFAYVRLG